jgi:hypothetical protein
MKSNAFLFAFLCFFGANLHAQVGIFLSNTIIMIPMHGAET